MKRRYRYKSYLINLIFPAVIFGSLTGMLTALIVSLYKLCAKYVISFSESGYHWLSEHLWAIIPILAGLLAIAFLFTSLYRKTPNLRGGGIPTSIGVLRGIISFEWLKNLLGTFFLSLASFLIGVPLGNEGPSVQMGTAIGRGSVFPFSKKHRAWDRYSMTGGACAGFSTATGAPLSGIMFAIEEAHQRISPMIMIVSATSVMVAGVTTELLAMVLPIPTALFPTLQPMKLTVKDAWLPVLIGVAMGLFSVVFLKYYRLINGFFRKCLSNVALQYKIFLIFGLTVALGLCSHSFVSTGHELMLSLFDAAPTVSMLALVLLVRSTLTLSANSNGVTGGVFVPILAIGAVFSALLGRLVGETFGLGGSYYSVVLVLGITACISGMMKMPLTAILFSLEALSCFENILYVIIVAAVTFMITELFGAKSINEHVLEHRIEQLHKGQEPKVIDTFVTVQKNSFAVGKQIRDIFWPANLFVLSVQHDKNRNAEVDEHGAKAILEGDLLHVRFSTFDELETKQELMAIVGEQNYEQQQVTVI